MKSPGSPVVLVTGGTAGIGYQIALALVRRGASVTVTGRNLERGGEAVRSLSGFGVPATFLFADLSHQKGTLALADSVRATHQRLDVLINNVGGVWNRHARTTDGLERTLAINHVHPFLLSEALFPLLKATRGKVVHLSTGYHLLVRLGCCDWNQERWDSGMNVYGRAKLISLLAGRSLCQRWAAEGVVIQFADPGMAPTPLTRSMDASYFPWYGRWLYPLIRRLQDNAPLRWAGKAAVDLALDVGDRRPGLYVLPWGLRLPATFRKVDRLRGRLLLSLTLNRWLTEVSRNTLEQTAPQDRVPFELES